MPSGRSRPTTGFISLVKTLGALANQKGKLANSYIVSFQTTRGAKLLNADWLRKRTFFLNHEGTFGNQEGMIT